MDCLAGWRPGPDGTAAGSFHGHAGHDLVDHAVRNHADLHARRRRSVGTAFSADRGAGARTARRESRPGTHDGRAVSHPHDGTGRTGLHVRCRVHTPGIPRAPRVQALLRSGGCGGPARHTAWRIRDHGRVVVRSDSRASVAQQDDPLCKRRDDRKNGDRGARPCRNLLGGSREQRRRAGGARRIRLVLPRGACRSDRGAPAEVCHVAVRGH